MNEQTLTPEQWEKIGTFQAFTGKGDDEDAMKYLTSCNWDVEQAVNLSFAGALDFPQQAEPQPQGFGGPVENVYQNVTSNATGMPLFTPAQMTYHRYIEAQDEYKSQMKDETKSALDFMDFVNANKTNEVKVEFEIGSMNDERF